MAFRGSIFSIRHYNCPDPYLNSTIVQFDLFFKDEKALIQGYRLLINVLWANYFDFITDNSIDIIITRFHYSQMMTS